MGLLMGKPIMKNKHKHFECYLIQEWHNFIVLVKILRDGLSEDGLTCGKQLKEDPYH